MSLLRIYTLTFAIISNAKNIEETVIQLIRTKIET